MSPRPKLPRPQHLTLLTLALLGPLFSASARADAAVDAHPMRGPYVIAAAATVRQVLGDDLFCLCRKQPQSTNGFKVGGGYRFGVASLEAWYLDLGHGDYTRDIWTPAQRLRLSATSLGAAWSARFGSQVEATWRVAAASVQTSAEGRPTRRVLRPLVGMGMSVALTPQLALELAGDYTSGEDSGSTRVTASMASLGVRMRY